MLGRLLKLIVTHLNLFEGNFDGHEGLGAQLDFVFGQKMEFVRLSEPPRRYPVREAEQPATQLVHLSLELIEQVRQHDLIHILVEAMQAFFNLLGLCEQIKLFKALGVVLFEHQLDFFLDSELPLVDDSLVEVGRQGFVGLDEDKIGQRVTLDRGNDFVWLAETVLSQSRVDNELAGDVITHGVLEQWRLVDDLDLSLDNVLVNNVKVRLAHDRHGLHQLYRLLFAHKMVDWPAVVFVSLQSVVARLHQGVPLHFEPLDELCEARVLLLNLGQADGLQHADCEDSFGLLGHFSNVFRVELPAIESLDARQVDQFFDAVGDFRARAELRPQLEGFTEEHALDVQPEKGLLLHGQVLDSPLVNVSLCFKVRKLETKTVCVESLPRIGNILNQVAVSPLVVIEHATLDRGFSQSLLVALGKLALQRWMACQTSLFDDSLEDLCLVGVVIKMRDWDRDSQPLFDVLVR